MADTTASPVPEVAPGESIKFYFGYPRVAKGKPAVARKSKPTRPSTADMVNSAIKMLAEENGSSLQAIKKYIAATYEFNTIKYAFLIKNYLKSAVASGVLIQTSGKGAAGSFKLALREEISEPEPEAVAAKNKILLRVFRPKSQKRRKRLSQWLQERSMWLIKAQQ